MLLIVHHVHSGPVHRHDDVILGQARPGELERFVESREEQWPLEAGVVHDVLLDALGVHVLHGVVALCGRKALSSLNMEAGRICGERGADVGWEGRREGGRREERERGGSRRRDGGREGGRKRERGEGAGGGTEGGRKEEREREGREPEEGGREGGRKRERGEGAGGGREGGRKEGREREGREPEEGRREGGRKEERERGGSRRREGGRDKGVDSELNRGLNSYDKG